jgi:hypothetical protein
MNSHDHHELPKQVTSVDGRPPRSAPRVEFWQPPDAGEPFRHVYSKTATRHHAFTNLDRLAEQRAHGHPPLVGR